MAQDSLKRVLIDQDKESTRQIGIIYGGTAIALHRKYKLGKERIKNLLANSEMYWNEVTSGREISILQMLEDKTGIDMRLEEDGKSWKEIPMFNALNKRKRSQGVDIMFRRLKIKWTGTLLMACILMGLYEYEHFGVEKLNNLMHEVMKIREQYNYDPYEITKVAYYEVGVKFVGYVYTEAV